MDKSHRFTAAWSFKEKSKNNNSSIVFKLKDKNVFGFETFSFPITYGEKVAQAFCPRINIETNAMDILEKTP